MTITLLMEQEAFNILNEKTELRMMPAMELITRIVKECKNSEKMNFILFDKCCTLFKEATGSDDPDTVAEIFEKWNIPTEENFEGMSPMEVINALMSKYGDYMNSKGAESDE